MSEPVSNNNPPKRRGRPPKTEKRAVGRPKGEAGIMKEYKQRMLNSPKSRKVLDAIFEAALDPEHKNQATAWKLVIDRVAPVAMFEEEIKKGNGNNSISINISGVPSVKVGNDVVDGDYTEVDDES